MQESINISSDTHTPATGRDTFDRVSDIVKAAILGMAGGTGVASLFVNSLTGVVTGAVLGLIINAVFAWIHPVDWRDRAAAAGK